MPLRVLSVCSNLKPIQARTGGSKEASKGGERMIIVVVVVDDILMMPRFSRPRRCATPDQPHSRHTHQTHRVASAISPILSRRGAAVFLYISPTA
jgi:hypothetical protein